MPRCRKILTNGKRCKAHAIAGSKFCLFHTPGRGMKRPKKVQSIDNKEVSRAERVAKRTAENQIAVRSSRKAANILAGYGAYLQTRPDYAVMYTHHAARFNRQGTVMVGAKTQKTIQFTRTEGGRNFQKSDGSSRARLAMGRRLVWAGRLIPVLGYGYVGYNMYRDPVGTTQDMASPGIATSKDSMAYKVTQDVYDWGMMQLNQARSSVSPSTGVGFY